MIQVTLAGYTVHVAESMPECDDPGCTHAALVERFGSDTRDERDHRSAGDDLHLHVEVRRGSAWPFLCVAQHYRREAGWYPGVLLVPETATLFIGAGERLLAYDLHGPACLWENRADTGFHEWQRHDDLVVMSAELELAAWDLRGGKRWSTFVEPPWAYHVEGSMVYLDVMGTVSSFPLVSGPARP
jgi:hypothetical protein